MTISQEINFVNTTPVKVNNNTAYVRVKIFKKPIVAKMLIDSGNLVHDLISEDFAKKIRVKYTPVTKKIGTAAKGGSVSIVGQSMPIKIFIENVAKPVIIEPYVVRDLAHPINVGRSFLGRYEGKLEFTADAGYLEIKGDKTKLINKKEMIKQENITDARILKTLQYPSVSREIQNEMIYEGMVNNCESEEGKTEENTIPIYSKEDYELSARSALFIPFSTHGKLSLKKAMESELLVEPDTAGDCAVLLSPGLCQTIGEEAHCLVINPDTVRVKVKKGTCLGTVTVIERGKEVESDICTVTKPSKDRGRTRESLWKRNCI